MNFFNLMACKFRFSVFILTLFLFSCMDKEKPVTLGSSVVDKKISMTSSNVEGLKMDIYLISQNEVSGELLAKALNTSGQEIGRSKVILNLQKDDAKLLSFTFDSNVDMDSVTKFLVDFRKK